MRRAAKDLMRTHRKRALIVIITNFRDEDSTEDAEPECLGVEWSTGITLKRAGLI